MTDGQVDELILVYNADGGALSLAIDAVHKIVRPDTYNCDLCMITHGALTIRPEWKDFTRRLPIPTRALHRDEFAREFQRVRFEWPAVLVREGEALRLLIGPAELAGMDTVSALTSAIEERIGTQGAQPQETRSIT